MNFLKMLTIAMALAALFFGALALLNGEKARERTPCEPIGAVAGSLRCIEVWTPWEGNTGRGIWSTGNVDGTYRP